MIRKTNRAAGRREERLLAPDARVVFEFEEACIGDGRLAK